MFTLYTVTTDGCGRLIATGPDNAWEVSVTIADTKDSPTERDFERLTQLAFMAMEDDSYVSRFGN